MQTIISKGEFARKMQRSPACITKWIKEKKLSPAALVGEGQRARIWLERAVEDLKVTLDPAQQAAQAAPVATSGFLTQGADVPPAFQAPLARAAQQAQDDDEDLRRRRKADADRAEFDAEQKRRQLALDEGRWVDAAEQARVWSREVARLIADTETFLFTTLAREIAQRHGLDWKTLAVEIRELFHRYRATASEDAQARREAIEQEPEPQPVP